MEYGFTPAAVRQMTMNDVSRLVRFHKRNPSLRSVVTAMAVGFGLKLPNPDEPPKKYMTPEEFARMVRITGGRLE